MAGAATGAPALTGAQTQEQGADNSD